MKITGFIDTIAWYNQNAEKYAEIQGQLADYDQIDLFASKLTPKAYILDAGCAAGRDAHLFAEKGFVVEGIDASESLIRLAQKAYPSISFRVGNFLHLPFPDNSFDGIWAHQSLVHLETVADVTQAFNEFQRVLKTKAIVLVLVKAKMGKDKTAIVKDRFSNHDRFFQYFTKNELEELLQNTGYIIEHSEQFNETDRNPNGRPEVGLILVTARKS